MHMSESHNTLGTSQVKLEPDQSLHTAKARLSIQSFTSFYQVCYESPLIRLLTCKRPGRNKCYSCARSRACKGELERIRSNHGLPSGGGATVRQSLSGLLIGEHIDMSCSPDAILRAVEEYVWNELGYRIRPAAKDPHARNQLPLLSNDHGAAERATPGVGNRLARCTFGNRCTDGEGWRVRVRGFDLGSRGSTVHGESFDTIGVGIALHGLRNMQ
jgi:hypothetical protein